MNRRNTQTKYVTYNKTKRRWQVSIPLPDGRRICEPRFITKEDAIVRFNELADEHGLPTQSAPIDRTWKAVRRILDGKHMHGAITPFRDMYARVVSAVSSGRVDHMVDEEGAIRHPFTVPVVKDFVVAEYGKQYPLGYHRHQLCLGNFGFDNSAIRGIHEWTVRDGKLAEKTYGQNHAIA